jgi:large subunit ribosomal protein L9
MANNQVLLLQPIAGLGGEGDTVTVKAGYARNFLLPRKLALPITQANRKYVESLRKARELREQTELDKARELGARVSAANIALAVKTGEGGKLFGSVTALDLIARLAEDGIELTRKQLNLPAPIKTLGEHSAIVKLHPQVEVELSFEVVSENLIETEATSEAVADEA